MREFCKVPSCNRNATHQDMCFAHYMRFVRHGDVQEHKPIKTRASPGEALSYMIEHMFDDCPRWPFARTKEGYAKIRYDGEATVASRVVCELVHGPAPSDKHEAAHNCGKGHEGCFGANCLEWKTVAENHNDKWRHGTAIYGERSPKSKITENEVMELHRRANLGEDQRALAAEFGISQTVVSNIKNKKRWSHLWSGKLKAA